MASVMWCVSGIFSCRVFWRLCSWCCCVFVGGCCAQHRFHVASCMALLLSSLKLLSLGTWSVRSQSLTFDGRALLPKWRTPRVSALVLDEQKKIIAVEGGAFKSHCLGVVKGPNRNLHNFVSDICKTVFFPQNLFRVLQKHYISWCAGQNFEDFQVFPFLGARRFARHCLVLEVALVGGVPIFS